MVEIIIVARSRLISVSGNLTNRQPTKLRAAMVAMTTSVNTRMVKMKKKKSLGITAETMTTVRLKLSWPSAKKLV